MCQIIMSFIYYRVYIIGFDDIKKKEDCRLFNGSIAAEYIYIQLNTSI